MPEETESILIEKLRPSLSAIDDAAANLEVIERGVNRHITNGVTSVDVAAALRDECIFIDQLLAAVDRLQTQAFKTLTTIGVPPAFGGFLSLSPEQMKASIALMAMRMSGLAEMEDKICDGAAVQLAASIRGDQLRRYRRDNLERFAQLENTHDAACELAAVCSRVRLAYRVQQSRNK